MHILQAHRNNSMTKISATQRRKTSLRVNSLIHLSKVTRHLISQIRRLTRLLLTFTRVLIMVPISIRLTVPMHRVIPFQRLMSTFRRNLASHQVLRNRVQLRHLNIRLLSRVKITRRTLSLQHMRRHTIRLHVMRKLSTRVITHTRRLLLILIPSRRDRRTACTLRRVRAPLLVTIRRRLNITFNNRNISNHSRFLARHLVIMSLTIRNSSLQTVLIMSKLLTTTRISSTRPSVTRHHILISMVTFTIQPTVHSRINRALRSQTFRIGKRVISRADGSTRCLRSLRGGLNIDMPTSTYQGATTTPPGQFVHSGLREFRAF